MKPAKFKKKLIKIYELIDRNQFDEGLSLLEALQVECPCNASLLLLWSEIVQLQEKPVHSLASVKDAIKQAVDLETALNNGKNDNAVESVQSLVAMGDFLNNVEDQPKKALKYYDQAINAARNLLVHALNGKMQIKQDQDKSDEAMRLLIKIHLLTNYLDK